MKHEYQITGVTVNVDRVHVLGSVDGQKVSIHLKLAAIPTDLDARRKLVAAKMLEEVERSSSVESGILGLGSFSL